MAIGMSPQLLREIERFIASTGMGPTYFGKLAVGNPMLVKRLRQGQRVTLETAERVRAFIAERTTEPAE